MRSRALPLALLAVAIVLAAVALPPLLAGRSQTPAERVDEIAAGLRCPDCAALSVAESRTAAAAGIRAEIARQVEDGRTSQEIRAHFVERYGEWILLAPDDPLVWWLPALALAAALAALAAWLLTGRRRRPNGEAVAVTDAERQRIREELEAIDG